MKLSNRRYRVKLVGYELPKPNWKRRLAIFLFLVGLVILLGGLLL